MKNIDFESPRTRLAIRFFTYGVMTISTIAISAICLLFALGYRFDNNSLSVTQGGLIQLVSTPTNAQILLNGKTQDFRTPNKTTVMAGTYDVTMKLDGYRDWNKTVRIEAGQILWLNYTRFVPNDITTSNIREFDTLHASLASPNRRFIVMQPSVSDPRLVVADIRNEDQVVFAETTLPVSSYTQREGQEHTFEMMEWNLDGRYLLIRHTVGDVSEFIRFDRQNPSEAINLSARFGAISRAQFAGNNGNVLYAIVGNELQQINVSGDDRESLATGVTFFVVYRGDTIGYIADKQNKKEVGIIKDGRETAVSEAPAGTELSIAISHYFNHDYLAVANGQNVTIIKDPADAAITVDKVNEDFKIDQPKAEWLYFSNNGRFLVSQHQGSFTTYDLELKDTYKRQFATSQQVMRPFKWLDDYNLWVDLDNTLRIVEFDGTNERVITSVERGHSVTLSDNADVLFSIGKNNASNKHSLQSSPLTIE